MENFDSLFSNQQQCSEQPFDKKQWAQQKQEKRQELYDMIAALGFLRYNGMPAEKCIMALVRSEFLMPKRLTFHPTNLYYEILQPTIRKHEKEVKKNHD